MPWCPGPDGSDIWYETCGNGPALVLLHGWCMSSEVWKPLAERLSTRFRVIMPDFPGHGRSPSLGRADYVLWAEYAELLGNHLGLNAAVLAGWSMGGQAAMKIAADGNRRWQSLVLICSTACFCSTADVTWGLLTAEIAGMAKRLQRDVHRALNDFRQLMLPAAMQNDTGMRDLLGAWLGSVPFPDAATALDGLESLAKSDLRMMVPAIRIPTLVISGADDRICPAQASQWISDAISGSRHVTISGCGHAPLMTEPDYMARLIIESVSGQAVRDA